MYVCNIWALPFYFDHVYYIDLHFLHRIILLPFPGLRFCSIVDICTDIKTLIGILNQNKIGIFYPVYLSSMFWAKNEIWKWVLVIPVGVKSYKLLYGQIGDSFGSHFLVYLTLYILSSGYWCWSSSTFILIFNQFYVLLSVLK